MTAGQLTQAQVFECSRKAEAARVQWIRDHPQDYRGASRAAVDAQAACLLALHGRGRWR